MGSARNDASPRRRARAPAGAARAAHRRHAGRARAARRSGSHVTLERESIMRRLFVLLLLVFPAAALQAQRIQIDLPPSLAAKAAESVDVTLDGPLLRLAAKFLGDDKDDRVARDLIEKLEGIYVKSYEFDEDNAYDRSIVEKVRAQLGPSWKRLVQVKSRGREDTEIYTDMAGDKVVGLLVMPAEPRDLPIVNLVGPVDIEKLSSLEGHFGIPRREK